MILVEELVCAGEPLSEVEVRAYVRRGGQRVRAYSRRKAGDVRHNVQRLRTHRGEAAVVAGLAGVSAGSAVLGRRARRRLDAALADSDQMKHDRTYLRARVALSPLAFAAAEEALLRTSVDSSGFVMGRHAAAAGGGVPREYMPFEVLRRRRELGLVDAYPKDYVKRAARRASMN